MINETYKNFAQQIADLVSIKTADYSKSVNVSCGGFCPEIVFIKIDALHEKDYPHNIAENSIYLDFKINFELCKFEVFRCGHVYLSEADKQTEKYRYLVMRSICSLLEKKFRKTKHKDIETTAKVISDYFNTIMEKVTEYTGGYPYKI